MASPLCSRQTYSRTSAIKTIGDEVMALFRSTRPALAASALALLCFVTSEIGWAQQSKLETAAQLLEKQARAGKGEFVTFLMGAASAYRWDSAAEGADPQRLFCPPPRHSVDARSYARIAVEEYRRAKSEYAALTEYPLDVLALALQRGLRARYPCPDRTPLEKEKAP